MVFIDKDIYEAVKNSLPSVNEYVSSHGGEITLLGVKNGVVYIELTGACKGCAMSLMTTKMVVQKKLRILIHPELNVINNDGSPENRVPNDIYAEELTEEEISFMHKGSLFDKVKDFLHI